MQVLHYLPAGVPVNAAACLWAAEQGAAASCRAWCRWQDFTLMRSWAAIRGNFFASCIPEGAPDGKSAPPWQYIAAVHPKRAGIGKICAPCIRKASQTAAGGYTTRISCQGGVLFAALTPRIMHGTRILPGSPHCTDPSNHAYRADLAVRRRRTARAIASTAPPLWRGSLPRDGRTGRGRLLVGRGGAAEGVRGAVGGHRALTEKPASAKRRLQVSDVSNFAESREPVFAGRVQGGAAARRRLSSGPAEWGRSLPVQKVVSAPHRLCRQLLRRAVRALGISSIPLDEKVNPLVLFALTIPPRGI